MTLSRRSLITGLVSFVAAPAIVRASSLMPVKTWAPYADDVVLPQLPIARFLCDSVNLKPGSLNYAEPYPGFRFRFENGILIHEPDPDAAKAA